MALLSTIRGLVDSAVTAGFTSTTGAAAGGGGGGGGSGLISYNSLDSLPTSNLTNGDQAFVTENKRLYISNGSGWYNVALVNLSPSFDSSILSQYTLEDSTDSLIIRVPASDSDNPSSAITYSHEWTDIGDSADYIFRVSQDSSVFTITPMGFDSAEANVAAGYIDSQQSNIGITFKATDGIGQASISSSVSYSWAGFPGYSIPGNNFTFYGYNGNYNEVTDRDQQRVGPTLARLKTNYSSAAWTQSAANFWVPMKPNNVDEMQGFQTFRAPQDGTYFFDVYGACGCNGTATSALNNSQRGGLGARMRANILNVKKGDYFQVIVGHCPAGRSSQGGGGGGGSFVFYKSQDDWTATGLQNGFTTSDIVIAAGGGGGGGRETSTNTFQEGVHGSYVNYTTQGSTGGPGTTHRYKFSGGASANSRTAGTGGGVPNGTNGPWGGGDGAGLNADAAYYAANSTLSNNGVARGYANYFVGGAEEASYGGHGGFGGGGGSSWGQGGGGGYSGGSGDYSSGSSPTNNSDNGRNGGGGGGSIITSWKSNVQAVGAGNATNYSRSGYVYMSIS